jgi:hypothetical protein
MTLNGRGPLPPGWLRAIHVSECQYPSLPSGCGPQYLYRLSGLDGTLSMRACPTTRPDPTRRLRRNWQTKQWATEIRGISLKRYPDRRAVLAAERKAIKHYDLPHPHALPS